MNRESEDALRAKRIAALKLHVACALMNGRGRRGDARPCPARDQDKPFRRTQ